MKILILNSSNPFISSGIVALDIYNGLKEIEGNEVKMVVRDWDKYTDKNIIPINSDFQEYIQIFLHVPRRILNKLWKIFFRNKVNYKYKVKTNPDYCLQDIDQTITYFKTSKILKRACFRPEVIIVLFMPHFLSYKNLYELNISTKAKIYLYPMDMAPFTGGCHYSWKCDRYIYQCGSCPALYSNNSYDQSYINHKFKRDLIQRTNLALFAANNQIANQLKESTIFEGKEIINEIYPLPDETIFYPRSKEFSREYFKIDSRKKVLFFGAVTMTATRKGGAMLIEALKILCSKLTENNYNTNDVLLLVAGKDYNQIKPNLPFDSLNIGFIQDYNVLALAYSASDFYISPSLEDSGPTMVLQSMMCNIPVISFDIGYSQSFIKNRVNGFKCEQKEAHIFAKLMFEALSLGTNEINFIKSEIKNSIQHLSRKGIISRINESLHF